MGRPIQQLRRYLLDRMVLRPSRHRIDHATKQRVMLTALGRPLECFVERNHEADLPPEVLILKFPGTAGRAERSTTFPAELLPGGQRQRVTIWTWNPPGYGGSGGRASLGRIADAAMEFWNHVIDRDHNSSTAVLLCGNSLGCVTTLHVAAAAGDAAGRCGLVLRNPPPLIPVVKHIARRYPMSRLVEPIAESLCERMNAVVTAAKVRQPAVFIQSELDSLVLPEYQQQVFGAYAGEKKLVVLEGLSHAGIPEESHQPLLQESIQWLWRQLHHP